jgi:hypothetical protein
MKVMCFENFKALEDAFRKSRFVLMLSKRAVGAIIFGRASANTD